MDQQDQRAHLIAQEIDEPIPILFWSPREFMSATTLMGVGFMFDSMVLGVALAFMSLKTAKYLKSGAKRGMAIHLLWALGVALDPAFVKYFPSATKTEYFR